MPGQNILGRCTAQFPVTNFSTIVFSWNITSNTLNGSGSGSGSATFTRIPKAITPTSALHFSLHKSCCAKYPFIEIFNAFSCGSFSDSAPSPTPPPLPCAHTTNPVLLSLFLSQDATTGDVTFGFQQDGAYGDYPEYCINSGLDFSGAFPPIPFVSIIGTHTLSNSGGRFGGTWSWDVTLDIS